MRYTIGAIAAIAGALLLLVGTLLHPFGADPNDSRAAFTEYAADRSWVASHLMQLTGVVLMVFALAVLSRAIGDNSLWSHIGVVSAGASLAVAAVLQAVDGVALKMMVDRWTAAPAAEKDVLFHATFAVRQIEIGLASITSLLFGVTATIYGVALLSGPSVFEMVGMAGRRGRHTDDGRWHRHRIYRLFRFGDGDHPVCVIEGRV